MYYTGYFAVTLIFFGLIDRYLLKPHIWEFPILIMLTVFIGGGNYISLLPTVLILTTLTIFLEVRRPGKGITVGILLVFLLGGLLVSAMAPGNQIRQSGMWKMSA